MNDVIGQAMSALIPVERSAVNWFADTAYCAGSRPARAVRRFRDELMVKVQAVDVGAIEAVRAAVEERMLWAQAKIARYERLRSRLLNGHSEEEYLALAERVGPYLTLMRGLAFERENHQWGEWALAVLNRRSAATT
ncbi:hypothetical protein [Microtetraspora glauca]|uniref:Transcription regulator PadR C-terminal domain-containing protein n=1 Tax=Microtetraspora glauca TaxID=1996 RepID=A0ABV3GN23_MICGL